MFSQIIANSLVEASGYVLVALGFSLIYRTVGFFNFAHSVVLTIGAYGAYSFGVGLGLGEFVGALCGIGCAAVVGSFSEIVIFSPMRRRGANSLTLFLASLGILVVLQNCLSLAYGDGMILLRAPSPTPGHRLIGAHLTSVQICRVLVSIIALLGVGFVLKLTSAGKMIRAVANDRTLARIVGVKEQYVILSVIFFGSMLAGLAGVLIGADTSIRPTMGMHIFLMAIVGMIVGGSHRIIGIACGSAIVGLLRNFALWYFSGQWADLIIFSALILFLLVRPRGVLGDVVGKATT